MLDWLIHPDRREYMNVEFEPDTNVPLRFDTFNLYFGLKIEMMYIIMTLTWNWLILLYHISLMCFVKEIQNILIIYLIGLLILYKNHHNPIYGSCCYKK